MAINHILDRQVQELECVCKVAKTTKPCTNISKCYYVNEKSLRGSAVLSYERCLQRLAEQSEAFFGSSKFCHVSIQC